MSGAPKVALVHDWLTGMRGGEKVLEQIAALFPGAPIYTLLHVPGSVSPALEAHPIHTSFLQRAPFVRTRYRSYLPLFPAAIEDFDLTGYDLVISSSHCVAKGAIPAPGARHICYCHTPMRYAWDQEHVYFPRRRGLKARLRNLALSSLRRWDVASAERVDTFLTNSSWVAERVRRYYRREASVLHPPVDTERFTPAETEPARDYCLAVAAAVPYKRLDLAVEACRRLGRALRIVGGGPELRRLQAESGSGVEVLGRVGDEELRDLYRGAACYVHPGLEDFGISTVEALACGTPVVALRGGGVLDIVEDGRHGVLFEGAGNVEALAAAIDKCSRLGFNTADLRSRAEGFSTRQFATRFRSLLEAATGASGSSGA